MNDKDVIRILNGYEQQAMELRFEDFSDRIVAVRVMDALNTAKEAVKQQKV